MIRILMSDLGNYVKKDGKKVTQPVDNSNGIVDDIKKHLKSNKRIVFVTSDIDQLREVTEDYARILFDSLKMVGISFDEYSILDRLSMDKAKDLISESSLVFLCGGNTYKQNLFFKKINLKEILKEYDGLVIGQSAGAINMAIEAYDSPEELDRTEPTVFPGLGLTDLNVEPHFIFDDCNFSEEEKYQRENILKESYNRKIYGQCNGSHITIDDENNVNVCGETYVISNGNIDLIDNQMKKR